MNNKPRNKKPLVGPRIKTHVSFEVDDIQLLVAGEMLYNNTYGFSFSKVFSKPKKNANNFFTKQASIGIKLKHTGSKIFTTDNLFDADTITVTCATGLYYEDDAEDTTNVVRSILTKKDNPTLFASIVDDLVKIKQTVTSDWFNKKPNNLLITQPTDEHPKRTRIDFIVECDKLRKDSDEDSFKDILKSLKIEMFVENV